MKRLKAVLVLGLLVAAPSFAADKWTKVQTRNFTLVGSASENQIREVAENLEVFRTAYGKFFKLREGSTVATTVVVFKSDSAFRPFKPLYQGKPASVSGYFQPGDDMNYIALAADEQTPRVIYHEYVHRLMSDNMGSLPPWFQEGFAECFSSMEVLGRDKKVRMGRAIGEHVALLNQRRFMPLEKLFAVENGSPEYNEEEKQGVFYAQSWAFVHYMMLDNADRRNQFFAFLEAIRSGKPAVPAFEEAFRTTLTAFQKTFEAYIQQRVAWNLFEVQTPEGLDRSRSFTVTPLTEAEAEFYMGDLLLHADRPAEAETHLSAAINLDPKLGSAQGSMGRLLMRQKKEPEALAYLRRATELDAGNYLTHYYYASLLHSADKPSDEDFLTMRSALQTAIRLAPEFVEATSMLASINLSTNTDIPQTIQLLVKAVNAAPGRDYMVVQLAFLLSRNEQRANARQILRGVLSKATLEAPLRKNAEDLMAFMDRADAADAQRRAIEERAERAASAANTERQARPRAALEEVVTDEAPNRPPTVVRNDAGPDAAQPQPAQIRVAEEELAPGTAKIRGTLTGLECVNGATFSLTVDGRVVRLHSTNPGTIQFTSFNPSVSRQIACGAIAGGGAPAEILYRRTEGGATIGEPLTVTFVDPQLSVAPVPEIRGTTRVLGLLTAVDCSAGVTISLSVDGNILRFRTDSANKVAFLNGPNQDGTVSCGPVVPGRPVLVVYRSDISAGFMGEPVVVQFQR
jgi:tetratricopeptide (TPR) repeat protein